MKEYIAAGLLLNPRKGVVIWGIPSTAYQGLDGAVILPPFEQVLLVPGYQLTGYPGMTGQLFMHLANRSLRCFKDPFHALNAICAAIVNGVLGNIWDLYGVSRRPSVGPVSSTGGRS